MPDFSFENQMKEKGYKNICGIDEAGRGPLAGPVCAAAVILPDNCDIQGIDDSKKLSAKKREKLYDEIILKCVSYGIAFASVEEIEKYNILNATFIAMKRAVDKLKIKADFAIVDGNRLPDNLSIDALALIKGDSKSMSVAAASILAKVTRDRLLLEYDKKYPQYNFSSNKGYGTKAHIDAIKKFGPCEVHRMSFLKKI